MVVDPYKENEKRACNSRFSFLLYYCPLNFKDSKNVWLER